MKISITYLCLFLSTILLMNCSANGDSKSNLDDKIPVVPAPEARLLLSKNSKTIDLEFEGHPAIVTKATITILSGNGGYKVTPFRPEDAGFMNVLVQNDTIFIESIDPKTPFSYLLFVVEDNAGKKVGFGIFCPSYADMTYPGDPNANWFQEMIDAIGDGL